MGVNSQLHGPNLLLTWKKFTLYIKQAAGLAPVLMLMLGRRE
jgi:hypothetical protein